MSIETPGLATPAVLTQIEDAVAQGKDLWGAIRGIFNPREAEARRAAEIARLAAEDASRIIPTGVPAGIAVGPVIPLALAGVAAYLLLSSRR